MQTCTWYEENLEEMVSYGTDVCCAHCGYTQNAVVGIRVKAVGLLAICAQREREREKYFSKL